MRATASLFQKVYGIDVTPSMVELSAQYLEGLGNTAFFSATAGRFLWKTSRLISSIP